MHATLGFCAWDIPAVILLVAAVALLAVHCVKYKKRRKELESELSAKMAKKVTEKLY